VSDDADDGTGVSGRRETGEEMSTVTWIVFAITWFMIVAIGLGLDDIQFRLNKLERGAGKQEKK
jgi:hypothetical protein